MASNNTTDKTSPHQQHPISDLESNDPATASKMNDASSSLCAPTRVRVLIIALVVSILLLVGALVMLVVTELQNDDNASKSYQKIGSTIPTAETERNVYSTTPVTVSQPSPGKRLRLALGDMAYMRPGDTVPWEGPSASRGRVRVFELVDGKKYQQVGQTLEGTTELSYFGSSVALSSDGQWLAVGAVGENDFAGSVFLYVYDTLDRSWKLERDDFVLDQESTGRCGHDVQLASNTLVYSCSQSEEIWTVHPLVAADAGDLLTDNHPSRLAPTHRPWAVQLSQDGTSMLVSDAGPSQHSVYDLMDGAWTLRGGDDLYQKLMPADGVPLATSETRAVTMSADGSILAAVYRSSTGSNQLVVRAVRYYGNTWTDLGGGIEGDELIYLPPNQEDVDRLLVSAGGEQVLVVTHNGMGLASAMQVYSLQTLRDTGGASSWWTAVGSGDSSSLPKVDLYPAVQVYDVAMTYDGSFVAATLHESPTEFYAQAYQLR